MIKGTSTRPLAPQQGQTRSLRQTKFEGGLLDTVKETIVDTVRHYEDGPQDFKKCVKQEVRFQNGLEVSPDEFGVSLKRPDGEEESVRAEMIFSKDDSSVHLRNETNTLTVFDDGTMLYTQPTDSGNAKEEFRIRDGKVVGVMSNGEGYGKYSAVEGEMDANGNLLMRGVMDPEESFGSVKPMIPLTWFVAP